MLFSSAGRAKLVASHLDHSPVLPVCSGGDGGRLPVLPGLSDGPPVPRHTLIIYLYCRCVASLQIHWLIHLYCRYAQVVTVAVYLFFLACLMGRQSPDTPGSFTCIANVLRW